MKKIFYFSFIFILIIIITILSFNFINNKLNLYDLKFEDYDEIQEFDDLLIDVADYLKIGEMDILCDSGDIVIDEEMMIKKISINGFYYKNSSLYSIQIETSLDQSVYIYSHKIDGNIDTKIHVSDFVEMINRNISNFKSGKEYNIVFDNCITNKISLNNQWKSLLFENGDINEIKDEIIDDFIYANIYIMDDFVNNTRNGKLESIIYKRV